MLSVQGKTALTIAICTALGAGQADAATFNVTNADDSGPGSLRQALSDANVNGETDVVDLSQISGQTVNLTGGALEIYDDEIEINGAGVTIDAGGDSRVFQINGSEVSLNGLTITGGGSVGEGGGIYSEYGSLELNDCTISGNAAIDEGGGIYHIGYELEIYNSVISGNQADRAAGVFAYSFGDIRILDSVITGNVAEGDDEQILSSRPRILEMEDLSELSGRARGGSAGGAFLFAVPGDFDEDGPQDIRPSGFVGDRNILIERSTISNNHATSNVGGISAYSPGGTVTLNQSLVSGNSAGEYAGGGYLLGKYATVFNSTISGNSAGGEVGGMLLISVGGSKYQPFGSEEPAVEVSFSTIVGNSAGNRTGGVGLYTDDGSPIGITASVISSNTAPVDADLSLGSAVNELDEPEIQGVPGQTANLLFSLLGVDPSGGTLDKDIVSQNLSGQDPLLGPLADNGGPTLTHLPLAGSPLIGAIPEGEVNCTPGVGDQRGEDRPTDGDCNIGAVEAFGAPVPEATAVPVFDRLGMLLMSGLLGLAGLLGFRRRRQSGSC